MMSLATFVSKSVKPILRVSTTTRIQSASLSSLVKLEERQGSFLLFLSYPISFWLLPISALFVFHP